MPKDDSIQEPCLLDVCVSAWAWPFAGIADILHECASGACEHIAAKEIIATLDNAVSLPLGVLLLTRLLTMSPTMWSEYNLSPRCSKCTTTAMLGNRACPTGGHFELCTYLFWRPRPLPDPRRARALGPSNCILYRG